MKAAGIAPRFARRVLYHKLRPLSARNVKYCKFFCWGWADRGMGLASGEYPERSKMSRRDTLEGERGGADASAGVALECQMAKPE